MTISRIQGEFLQKLTFCSISFRWTNPFLHSGVAGRPLDASVDLTTSGQTGHGAGGCGDAWDTEDEVGGGGGGGPADAVGATAGRHGDAGAEDGSHSAAEMVRFHPADADEEAEEDVGGACGRGEGLELLERERLLEAVATFVAEEAGRAARRGENHGCVVCERN